MGLRIHTPEWTLGVQRHLHNSTENLGKHFRRISSGLRIESAADDPAGLGISERQRTEIRSLGAAARAVQDGISVVRTAEGALDEFSALVIGARELVVRSNTGTLTPVDRQTLDVEFHEIASELQRLARDSEFNVISLLGARQTLQITAGDDAGETIDIKTLNLQIIGIGLGFQDLDTTVGRQTAEVILDQTTDLLGLLRGYFGSVENRLASAEKSLQVATENLTVSESRIRDADMGRETSEIVRLQILQQAGMAALVQANIRPAVALRLLA